MSSEPREVLISVNPIAGRGNAAAKVVRLFELLDLRGFSPRVVTDLANVADLAQKSLGAGALRAVVAAGGDGTVAELINRCDSRVPIATLPLGTENLLAKYLRIGESPHQVASVIDSGLHLRLDAGLARCAAAPGHEAGERKRLFLLMASCGFDADVVHRLSAQRKGNISHWSYVKPIVGAMRNYAYPKMRVTYKVASEHGVRLQQIDPNDTSTYDSLAPHNAAWVFLFNLPCYAWGIGRRFAARACGNDGRFDLFTLKRGSLFHGLRYLAAVAGRHVEQLADCTFASVTRLRVESDEPVPCQFDGDPGGFLPLEIELLPGRVTLLVPPDFAAVH